ncbi:hypothetical protein PC110_g15608 [Phytophthora cactorum]|nr:hypothetical protein PC113_g6266 [Phytophthora cactorum]KAG3034784.1 hypothetical protein PC119_g4782 [Phytophthora cactorum]KAG3187089.1 hypothetical protein C6341_g3468 [Phytophthora cactorum]RAW28000.1 hypothetical protein PC110_g15608 [Phytophthora cactorum]
MAFFLQEDDDAFVAALSFLDEFAPGLTPHEGVVTPLFSALCGSSESLEHSTDSAATYTTKPKSKRTRRVAKKHETEEEKMRRKAERNEKRKLLRKAGVYGDANRARNERSREIAYLRDQMEKLQLDLRVLQTQRAKEKSEKKKQKKESETALVRKKSTQITTMWQGLAEQQKRRREEAERDNVLLKLAIERHTKVADNLRGLMQRRATQLTNECSSLMTLARSKHHHVVDVLPLRGDIGDFEGLFQRLEDSYRMLDDVFMANGLAGMTTSPVDVHVREGVYDTYFELSSYKVLPFDVRTTSEAAWNHFKGVEKHLGNGSLYEKAEKGLDDPYTLIADLKKEVFSNSSRADIRVKQAVRRYIEEDRDVIAWTSRVVPIEIKHKLLRGLTYHLRGYAITKRSPDSTPEGELSVLQLCYLVSLDQDIDTTYGHDDARTITDFMIVSLGQNMRGHREFIENALVDTTAGNWLEL